MTWVYVLCARCFARYGREARPVFRVEISRHPVLRFEVRRTPRGRSARWVDVESDPRSLAQVVSCDRQHAAWPVPWRDMQAAVIDSLKVFTPRDLAAGNAFALVDLPGNDPAAARRLADSVLTDDGLDDWPSTTPNWMRQAVERAMREAS